MIIPNNCPICDLPLDIIYEDYSFKAQCNCSYFIRLYDDKNLFQFYDRFFTPIYHVDNVKTINYFCSRIYRRMETGPVWFSKEYLILESDQYISHSNLDRFLNMKVFI